MNVLSLRSLFLATLVTLILPSYALRDQRVAFMRSVMKIQTPKSDPPRIAFLDIMMVRSPSPKVTNAASIDLTKIIAEKKLHPVAQSFKYRRIALPEMTIRPMTYVFNDVTQAYEEDWTKVLTPREREWIQASNIRGEDMDFSKLKDPLQEALKEKVQQEIQNVKSTVPSGWVISKSKTDPQGLPTADSATQGRSYAGSSDSSRDDQGVEESPPGPQRKAYKGNFRVSGHLTLDSSTAFLPGDHFEVHWMRESISRKAGQFFPHKEQTFAIDVSELIGMVRVDLYDAYGTLKGLGELQLSPDLTTAQLANAEIQLRPARRQFMNYQSHYPGKRTWDKGQIRTKVATDEQTEFAPDREGKLLFDGVAPRSSAFAYSDGKEFYPAIHVLQTGEKQSMTMLPRRWVRALQQVVQDQQGFTSIAPNNGAVVMGQAKAKGKPLAGVRISVEEAPSAKLVYLNALQLPDPTLTATSENGQFVILDLPLGYYSLKGFLGAQFFGFGNVLSEPEAVSFVEIEGNLSTAPFEVRAFDAFTGDEKNGELHLQSLGEQVINVPGYGLLDVPRSQQLTLAWFEPDDKSYVGGIYVIPPRTDFLHAPMVRQEWIESLLRQSGLALEPGRGNVLGFVRKGNYDINLPHVDADSGARVVFFNSAGQLTEGPVAEGGFLVVNVPPSGQTVVIRHHDGEVDSQIIPIDENQMTIVRFLP